MTGNVVVLLHGEHAPVYTDIPQGQAMLITAQRGRAVQVLGAGMLSGFD